MAKQSAEGNQPDTGLERRLRRAEAILVELAQTHAKMHDQMLDLRRVLAGENPVRAALEIWAAHWQERWGAAYTFNRQVDPAAVKRLLTKIRPADLHERMARYMRDADPFIVRNKHPLNIFIGHVNTYAATTNNEIETASGAVDCRHLPPCRNDQEHTRRKLADARGE
jgi:hypothetical protein